MSCPTGLGGSGRVRIATRDSRLVWVLCLLLQAGCVAADGASDAANEPEPQSSANEQLAHSAEDDQRADSLSFDNEVEEVAAAKPDDADVLEEAVEPVMSEERKAPDESKAPDIAHKDDKPAASETAVPRPEISDPEPNCLPDTGDETVAPAAGLPPLPDISAGPCAFEPVPTARVNSSLCPNGVVHGDVYIKDGAELLELQECKRVTGNVSIHVDATTYTFLLRNVRVIEGNLNIDSEQCRPAEDCPAGSERLRFESMGELRCVGGDVRIYQGRPRYKQGFDLSWLGNLVEVGGSIDLSVLPGSKANTFSSLRRVWGDVKTTESFTPPRLETVWGSVSRPNCAAPKFHVGCAAGKPLCSDGIIGCDHTVTSQEGLAAVSECTHALGDLTLAGADITDLSPLAKLQSVRGKLSIGILDGAGYEGTVSIGFLGTLPTTAGLEALHSVGHLLISKQPLLTDLAGLSGLRKVDQIELVQLDRLADLSALAGVTGAVTRLHLDTLPMIEDLDGLSNAVITGWLHLRNLPALHDLTALRVGASMRYIDFARLPKLTTLAALGTVETLSSLWLTDLPGLRNDLSGLGALRKIERFLSLSSLGVTSLDGMPNLQAVGQFSISRNFSLRSLRGLDGVTSVTYFSGVSENYNLPQCEVDRLAARWPLHSSTRNGIYVPDATCAP